MIKNESKLWSFYNRLQKYLRSKVGSTNSNSSLAKIMTWMLLILFLLPVICRICGGCKQDIRYGNYLGCMGTFFHPQCFCCRSCGHPIVENEVHFVCIKLPFLNSNHVYIYDLLSSSSYLCFFLIQVFSIREGSLSQVLFQGAGSSKMWSLSSICKKSLFWPCHSLGFGNNWWHKFDIDELSFPPFQIPTNRAGLIEYRCHPFWSQKYCPSHEHDNTARCCSCERLEVLI